MVSKLNILSRYYQIHIDILDESYFYYQDRQYYLSYKLEDTSLQSYYQMYVQSFEITGFVSVANCFGNMESEGYTLYVYDDEEYSLPMVLQQSFKVIQNQSASLNDIKQSWCAIIDHARKAVASHASRINHNEYYVILSYYYQGLGENVISIINEILVRHPGAKLPLGYQHSVFHDEYCYLFNPCNFLISTRVRDIALAYRHQYISIDELEQYIQPIIYNEAELMYLYCRVVFPSEFFRLILSTKCTELELKEKLVYSYNYLETEKNLISNLYFCLQKYVDVPKISWIMQER